MRLALSVVTLVIALPASADTFYLCRKAGATAFANGPTVAGYKRQGYACTPRMQFPDRSSQPASREPGDGVQSSAPTTPLGKFAGPAGERETYEPYIREAAERYKVPANLIRAVIRVESNFRPHAVSQAGAQGLMQLMPRTAKELGVTDAFDPKQSILNGTKYLRMLINRFKGDPKLTLAAYHAGPTIVEARGDIPFEATRQYVRNVLTHFYRYRDMVPSASPGGATEVRTPASPRNP